MVDVTRLIKSTLLFLLLNGGELHQLYTVLRTGCVIGLRSSRFVALCFSHLVAASTHHTLLDRESIGLLFVSLQHGILATLALQINKPLLLILLYVLLGVGIRWNRSVGNFLYNITPIYTTIVKVAQLRDNWLSSHTGTLSPISTSHILLLSMYHLYHIPVHNTKIRVILVVCLVTNTVQLLQCWWYREETWSVVERECGFRERVFVVDD